MSTPCGGAPDHQSADLAAQLGVLAAGDSARAAVWLEQELFCPELPFRPGG